MLPPLSHSASESQHPKIKIVFIDYLKVLLTALVIVHHALVTYGAPQRLVLF
jgi:hypothetical protein